MSIATRRRQMRSGATPPENVIFARSVVLRKIDELSEYPNNARTHSRAQISQIAESIRQFGFTVPCLIDDQNQLLAGHGRVEAARLLDMEEVPCLVLKHLSAAQKKAYRLADNKLAENSGWDSELLARELDLLNDENFLMDVIGFDDKELMKLWDMGDGLGAGGDAAMTIGASSWAVIVECDDEDAQVALIDRLMAEGYKVRGSIG